MADDALAASVSQKITDIKSESDTFQPDPAYASISSPDKSFAQTIDHTLLKPDATPAAIDALCDEAIRFAFKSCCVNGTNVKRVSERLSGSETIPCCVIGFPLGASTSAVKAFEAAEAIKDGAKEIDMVLNIGLVKSRAYASVLADIQAVVRASSPYPVKVILETALLSQDEIIAGSFLAAEAGAAFVKTCTGFGGGQAEVEHVRLMARTVAYKPEVKVKASGGVRSFERCLEMYKAGAQRIGTSSGAAIMGSVPAQSGAY